MKTERIIVKGADDQAGIRRAAQLLRSGQVVAIPTETVYGLAASAYDPEAVKAVFVAKGRPQDNPLIVHIADKEQLSAVAAAIPETAKRCADAFWPGPFTMILPRGEKIPASVSAGLDTVAVRLPSHQIARAIIRAGNLPLAAPSANTSGKPSPTSAAHVLEDLDGKISAVVMGDDCEVGVESTVVDLCSDPPRLLRPGAVTVEELRRVLPDLIVDQAVLAEPIKGQKVASPG
ncbi:MAG: threonylcarbamoyl-AMP synthase, partial [Clostridia bacterium]|nr:threonylcarbamoyl-AMP synthase [Clostridia bacterium]